MERVIRDFREEDKEIYMQLSKQFYSSTAVDHKIPEVCFERTFEACINKSPYTRGVSFLLDDEMIGYGLISITWSNEVGGICILLEELYISSSYQGTGFGTSFFDWIKAEYQGEAKRFRLEVTPNNERAIELYKRLGFSTLNYLQMIKDTNRL